MIAHLRGQVRSRGGGRVVLDVHGVGYLVHVPATETIPAVGQEVELATSMQVREDSMTLYGFVDPVALQLFELLISSSGVGPKLALAALGTHRPATLRQAIADEDLATLTQVSGIGKKVAERLVLELKDKVGVVAQLGDDDGLVVTPSTDDTGTLADARAALQSLGYTAAEIAAAMRELGRGGDVARLDTATAVRLALRALATSGERTTR